MMARASVAVLEPRACIGDRVRAMVAACGHHVWTAEDASVLGPPELVLAYLDGTVTPHDALRTFQAQYAVPVIVTAVRPGLADELDGIDVVDMVERPFDVATLHAALARAEALLTSNVASAGEELEELTLDVDLSDGASVDYEEEIGADAAPPTPRSPAHRSSTSTGERTGVFVAAGEASDDVVPESLADGTVAPDKAAGPRRWVITDADVNVFARGASGMVDVWVDMNKDERAAVIRRFLERLLEPAVDDGGPQN